MKEFALSFAATYASRAALYVLLASLTSSVLRSEEIPGTKNHLK